MGMFDTIKCLCPLPRGEEPKELANIDFNRDLIWQTKDLECSMDQYEIRQDGTLWIERYDIEDKSNPDAIGWARFAGMYTRVNVRWEPMSHYTGMIKFCEFYAPDSLENDYWIEYQATFIDGTVKKMSLEQFTATNNTERKNRTKEWESKMVQERKLWDKWYMKYGYKYYDKFVARIFKLWHNIPISAHQVERWLRPL